MISGALTRFSNKKERKPNVSAAKVGSLKAERKKMAKSRKPMKFEDVSTPVVRTIAKPKKAKGQETM